MTGSVLMSRLLTNTIAPTWKFCCSNADCSIYHENSLLYICAVYIPPDANAKLALARLQDIVNKSLVAPPDSIFIAAGDFNHADLKAVLHSFHPNVKCATRWRNTLDQVSNNIANACRTQAYPHLGISDHVSLLLHPWYTPKIRASRPAVGSVRIWPVDAIPRLLDCFSSTNWDIFSGPGVLIRRSLNIFHSLSSGLHQLLCGHCYILEADPHLPECQDVDDTKSTITIKSPECSIQNW